MSETSIYVVKTTANQERSVANMIVVESARKHIEVGFWDYARYGIPVTLLTTLVGMVLLMWK